MRALGASSVLVVPFHLVEPEHVQSLAPSVYSNFPKSSIIQALW